MNLSGKWALPFGKMFEAMWPGSATPCLGRKVTYVRGPGKTVAVLILPTHMSSVEANLSIIEANPQPNRSISLVAKVGPPAGIPILKCSGPQDGGPSAESIAF